MSTTPPRYVLTLPTLPAAVSLQKQKLIEYNDELWRRAEGAARLKNGSAIDAPDVNLAVAQILAQREGGTALGLFGGLLAGAGGGALLAWMPDHEKVTSLEWWIAGSVLAVGVFMMIVLAIREK